MPSSSQTTGSAATRPITPPPDLPAPRPAPSRPRAAFQTALDVSDSQPPLEPVPESTGTVTVLLRKARDGHSSAEEELFSKVYEELHRLAEHFMRQWPAGVHVQRR